MANYTFTAQSTDGEREFTGQLPEFALDSTLESILTALVGDTKQSKKSSDKSEKDMDELLEITKKAIDGDKKNTKEFADMLEDGLKKSNREGKARDDKAIGSYNARLAASEKALRSVSGGIQKLGLGAISLASALAVGFLNAITSAGESLNQLRDRGVAFGDAQGSTIKALGTLSEVGLSSVDFLNDFSRAAGVLGVNKLSEMTAEFDKATASGLELGLRLSENATAFANELQMRARLGILNNVSSAQLRKETLRSQQTTLVFSQALGIAGEDLEAFGDSLATTTNILSSSLLRFNNQTQSAMFAGVKEFGKVMAGLGGEGGESISEAMMEAAAGGALGFSQNLVNMTAVLPRLQQTTVQLTNAMQNGTLTQENAREISQKFAEDLGNLSEGEKQRIFAMERAGVEGATEMANAVRNFQASTKRLEDLKINPDAVQKGTNALNNILDKLSGVFDALRYSFLEGLGSVDGLSDAFSEAQEIIVNALSGAFGEATGDVKEFGKSIGERMPALIKKAAEMFAKLITYMPAIIDGFIAVAQGMASFFGFIADHSGKILALGAVILTAVAAVKLFSAYLTAKEFLALFKGGKGGGAGKGVQKQIMDGAGSSGKAAGGMKAFGGGFTAMMKGIVRGLKVLGKAAMNPMVWAGLGLITVAVLALATALRIAAPAIEAMGKVILNVMQGVGAVLESVGKGIAAIVTAIGSVILKVFQGIGAVIVSVGTAIQKVFEGIGSIIMGIGNAIAGIFIAIGKAAMMVGKGISFIFEGIAKMGDSFTNFIKAIGELNGGQLIMAAGGIMAVGAALLVLGAGSLAGGLMKGIGNFFGGDTIEQMIRLGNVAPGIVEMADVMSNFGEVIDKFTTALEGIDGDFIAGQMKIIEDSFESFGKALDNISFIDLFKFAALNLFGVTSGKAQLPGQADAQPGQPGQADAQPVDAQPDAVPTAQPTTSPLIKKAAKLGDNFTANYSQMDLMSADPETYEKFQAQRDAREKELIAGGTSKQRAELTAEREALKQYAPQISAAGAGTFKDADGNPVKFDAQGNVINNQPTPGTPATADTQSQTLATGDHSEDILTALNKQNSLLQRLVNQNQVIADNI